MRILSHVHIYYKEMWPELQKCLTNVMKNNQCDLYVTMVEKHEDLITDIKSFYPDTNIEIIENKGFDVAPFIHIINKVDLNNYDLVVKLHTKRNIDAKSFFINGFNVGADKWRKYLLNFCRTSKNWNASLKLLERDDVSCVSDYHIILNQDDNVSDDYIDNLEKKLDITYSRERKFVAGTMFVTKAYVFKSLQNKLKFDEFGPSARNNGDYLPYACERIFGFINDKKIVSYDGKNGKIEKILSLLSSFVYRHKINDTKESIKILGIPVYKKKIK